MPKWKERWQDPNAPVPVSEPPAELWRGPKAGNTTETLAPKTVNVLEPEPSWPKEEVYGDEPKPKPAPLVRHTFQERQAAKASTTLEGRVTKLEARVDSLLDRIATYNIKSSHKL